MMDRSHRSWSLHTMPETRSITACGCQILDFPYMIEYRVRCNLGLFGAPAAGTAFIERKVAHTDRSVATHREFLPADHAVGRTAADWVACCASLISLLLIHQAQTVGVLFFILPWALIGMRRPATVIQ